MNRFKACSPHVKFKSRKSSVLLLMFCYQEEKVIFFVDTEFLFCTLFSNSDVFINLHQFEIASLSIQIKPVNYLADETEEIEKQRQLLHLLFISLSLGEIYLSQTKIWSFIRIIISASILENQWQSLFIQVCYLK